MSSQDNRPSSHVVCMVISMEGSTPLSIGATSAPGPLSTAGNASPAYSNVSGGVPHSRPTTPSASASPSVAPIVAAVNHKKEAADG